MEWDPILTIHPKAYSTSNQTRGIER